MNTATLHSGSGRPSVRLERFLTDPPAIAWQSITDRALLGTWFPCDIIVADGDWIVGAELTFVFAPEVIDLTLTGTVLVVNPPFVLSFTWGDEILRFELSPHDRGTHLVLFDELEPSIAARNAAGWQVCLDRLMGVDPGPDSWQQHFDTYKAAFEPILGPQEGPPAGHAANADT